MIIDAHAHIGGSLIKREDNPEDALVALMDEYNVDKAIVFPIMPLPTKDPKAMENTREKDFKNERVISAVKKYPGRLFGALCVNPWKGEAVDKIQGGLERDGIVWSQNSSYAPCF
jgi:predicted TIM-barrel fold metal-dependent hydrolase